jgi:predicted small secreted protein
MLAAPYPTGGKNEKEEIASLVIAAVVLASQGCATIRGMGDDIQDRERREKDSLGRLGRT